MWSLLKRAIYLLSYIIRMHLLLPFHIDRISRGIDQPGYTGFNITVGIADPGITYSPEI
jgi:hypothetical protein